MSGFYDQLGERFMTLAIAVMSMEKWLLRSLSGRHVYGQLFRAVTSAGANYEEARAGESRADFIHKMQIVLKELRESAYWLRLIAGMKLNSADEIPCKELLTKTDELMKIIGRSIVTAKSRNHKPEAPE